MAEITDNEVRKALLEEACTLLYSSRNNHLRISEIARLLEIDLTYTIDDGVVVADGSYEWNNSSRCYDGEGWDNHTAEYADNWNSSNC